MAMLTFVERLWERRAASESPVIEERRKRRMANKPLNAHERAERIQHRELLHERLRRQAEERARLKEELALEADRTVLSRVGSTIRPIIIDVCKRHGMRPGVVFSRRRFKCLVRCRQEVMWHVWQTGKFSKSEIGRRLGDYDHSSVCHGIQQHQRHLDAAVGAGQ